MPETFLTQINIALARRDLDFIAVNMSRLVAMQRFAHDEAITQNFFRQVAFDVNRRLDALLSEAAADNHALAYLAAVRAQALMRRTDTRPDRMREIHDKEYVLAVERRIAAVLESAWNRLPADRAPVAALAAFVAEDGFFIEEYLAWRVAIEERATFVAENRVVGEIHRVLFPLAMIALIGFPSAVMFLLNRQMMASVVSLSVAVGLFLPALAVMNRGGRWRLARQEIAVFERDPRYLWLRRRFHFIDSAAQSVAWRNRRIADLQRLLFGDALTPRRETLLWMFIS
jgi:hypothetical protein